MTTVHFNLKKANRYLPYILLIGFGTGTANYVMNGHLNWLQSVIQALSTNFLIGYSLVVIASNKNWLKSQIQSVWILFSGLFLIYFLIGAIATEVEQIIRMSIFSMEKYQFFSAGKMYIFNGIISLVLGFSFFQNKYFFAEASTDFQNRENDLQSQEIEQNLEPANVLSKLPIKQGNAIHLISIQDIAYLEAFDNYSFVFDKNGEKRLCDYSLLFLQERLGENFLRIHRKYIVNSDYIKQVKAQANARYLILFEDTKLPPIMSSKSYVATIRKLIRIK